MIYIFGFISIITIIVIMIMVMGNNANMKCEICGNTYDFWHINYTYDTHPICLGCLNKASIIKCNNYSLEEIVAILHGKEILNSYNFTHKIGNFIAINSKDKTWSAFPFTRIYKYDDLIDYDVIENGSTISYTSKGIGGIGKAIVGGILFGGAGAVVGAVTATSTTKTTNITDNINRLEIKITVNDLNTRNIFIDMSEGNAENLKKINLLKQNVQDIISTLDIIKQNQVKNISSNINSTYSEADEIIKFKKLMDEGIISKEEFENKKKQILKIE